MCPIELHSVRLDAMISGTNVRTLAKAPGEVTEAWGGTEGVVGHSPQNSLCRPDWWCGKKHAKQFAPHGVD